MRKTYLDNIKWITVVLVVVYHVIYIFNGVQPNGVIGPFTDPQYQDLFHYLPLSACSYYLTGYIPGMPVVIYYLAAAVSAFAGAYILFELLSRIPLIRWLVCGISRKKRD